MTSYRPESILISSVLEADSLAIWSSVRELTLGFGAISSGVSRFISINSISSFVEPVVGTITRVIIDIPRTKLLGFS